jgi:hypothetical protein
MDHPRCTLGEFDVSHSNSVQSRYGTYHLAREDGGHYFVHGLALSPELQRRIGLLNCAAWLTEDRAPDDPWEAAKRVLTGRQRQLARDVSCVLSQPRVMLEGLASKRENFVANQA